MGERGAAPVGSSFGRSGVPGPVHPEESPVLSTFTADTAAALPGPDWLRDRRAAAARSLADLTLPSAEQEVWRYSRIADLDLDDFAPAAGAGAAPSTAPLLDAAVVIDVVDGAAAVGPVPAEWSERGVVVAAASSLDPAAAGLGEPTGDSADAFGLLSESFALDPLVISVPRGVVLDRPVLVRTHAATPGLATFPRVVVRLGEGAEATVVDHATSVPGRLLVVPVTDLAVARGARLRYVHVQALDASAWQIGTLSAEVGQEATLRAGLVGLGGDYARLRTDCRMSGRGADTELLAAYFGEDDQTLDFRTFQDHRAPDTTSNLLFKGAVGGRSRSVYTGLIRVEKEARGTNAFQTNRNVKLSEDAWAESVPNLEIETNDVRCSHASTVGPVDAEQRFYLESRGVTPAVADRLIVSGFFDEVVRVLPCDDVVGPVRAAVAAKLERTAGDLR